MERIDKTIASQGKYSRKDVKKIISQGRIQVNGETIKKPETKVNPEKDEIFIDGEKIIIKKYIYLILNKPKGYISATNDKEKRTVLDLVPEDLYREGLFPAGRLDIDTTGLMIITNDGEFAHNILSPKKHVKKQYEVKIDIDMNENMVEQFSSGIKLKDGECKSAILQITGKQTGLVTLTEGRYHQIKRMFGCFGAKVIELHRVQMGNLKLPSNLKEGECRELLQEELLKIKEEEV